MEKKISAVIRKNLKEEVKRLNDKITLVVVLVGNNSASKIYVRHKQRACDEVGINCEVIKLDENITEDELLNLINNVNNDESFHGLIVQLPLPKHLNANKIINSIDSQKDVDGLTVINQGKLANRQKTLIPATPKGVITLLDHYNINLEGKKALVIGRSNLVGKPLALLLLDKNATVTIAHSKTKDLEKETLNYDLIASCVGIPNFITSKMVKPGAIIVDVGISRVEGKVVGDCDFESLKDVASYITPVPGGVGPMTIASLLENVVESYKEMKGLL